MLPKLPTPIGLGKLKSFLVGYDSFKAKFLIEGFTFGFRIYSDLIVKEPVCSAPNLLSAKLNPEAVEAKLNKELQANRIAGPYLSPPFPNFHVSPLGIVPKKSPGEFRMIHHLSYPRGLSVNDSINPEHSSVTYSTIDDAIRCVKKSGVGSFLAKTDIKHAFRIIPIHPWDYHLLGMQWQGFFYYDKCMPMGCASSCKTFEALSSAIEWMARHYLHINGIVHLLDDFFICESTKDKCESSLKGFLELCGSIGIPMAPEKTFGPASTLSFAGIELDTVASEARLPFDKVQSCSSLVSELLHKKKATLLELQSLIGRLNFACSVVVPGRAFLRRLIDLTIGLRHPKHFTRLTKEVKLDLLLWNEFLLQFNGKSFFLADVWEQVTPLQLFTDSSGVIGFGAVFGPHWCYGKWPREWQYINIAILEFYPIVLSLFLWGDLMRNKCVTFFTDNLALVSVINKCSCKDKSLMKFVRKMVLVCLKYNILFKARHIPGVKNKLADALSRLQIQQFWEMAPIHLNSQPTLVPAELLPQSWVI